MTATAASRDDGPTEAGPPPSVTARAYFRLARGFWQGPTRLQAWRLTAGVLVFVLANLAAALGINRWNRYFFDALEKRDVGSVFWGIGVVAALVIFSAAATAGLLHMRMHLQLRWREWLTEHLIRRWLSDRRFYQLTIVAGGSENPEYRIADDVRLAVEPLVEFLIGLSNALLAAIAFIGVLWSVGGSLTIGTVTIPGYMVIAAIAIRAHLGRRSFVLGRPLIRYVESEERRRGAAALRAHPRPRQRREHRPHRRRRRRARAAPGDLRLARRALARCDRPAGPDHLRQQRQFRALADRAARPRGAEIPRRAK